MIIIGVTGFRRSGKNLTVDVLVKHFGFKQYAFADPLREMAAAVDPMISMKGVSAELRSDLCTGDSFGTVSEYVSLRYNEILELIGYEKAKSIPDFRQFLQRLGTEGIRNCFGKDAWVDAFERRITADGTARVAISDVRFHNEAAAVHKFGGALWRVSRPGIGGNDPHPSEIDIPNLPADRHLYNAGTRDEYEQLVIEAAQQDLPSLPRTN